MSEGVGAGALGGFNPLRGATTGVVIRRRATTEWMARGGWFLFFSWRLLRCRGEWEREHEGGLIRCAGRPQEWSCGAVPPQESL